MPKINPNLLPPPPASRVETVRAAVPNQGEFVIHLRLPTFAELLKQQELVREKTQEWERRGDWYPSDPPVEPSASLWQIVIHTLLLQVTEEGGELPPEDRYTESELVVIIARVPNVYFALANAIATLTLEAQGDLGNDLKAGAG